VALAAEIADRVPGVQMVRMTSSGTEAAMSAIRLARAATGRDTILKFAGAYHGHADGLLAQAGSGLATQGIPASPGVPASTTSSTVIVPWNDREAVIEATDRFELAAILAEPVPANMGVVAPADGFLDLLRERADQNRALLIFDEVITGFRVASGGAQERYGVTPDLTILGKIIGGGLPAAAYGGAAVLMERVAPAGDVYQAGTLAGNPLAVAAALATLELLEPSAYERLRSVTDDLAIGLRGVAQSAGCAVQVQAVPGLLTVFFAERPVCDYAAAAASDLDAYAAWCRGLLERGIYPPASQFEAWFPSLAHTDEDVERTVEAAGAAFAELAAG
jgi:glutamate-1-semialdehyde 2,1-aminomutase